MCFNGANIIFFYKQNCGICAFSSTAEQQSYQRAENDTCPQTWTSVTNKQKAPNQEEAIIALAKTFPASTSVTIQQAAVTIAHPSSFGGSYNERKFKIRKSTTLGCLRKQITVFTSPPFKWTEDVVYNQINGRLGNAKRSIRVTSVESSRGGLPCYFRCSRQGRS